jgi:site-specific DNA-methyltransferase (adenine-specific)
MENNKIYNTNCFDLLKEIPDKSVDLILTDPPYSIHATHIDKEIDLAEMWEHFNRIIKPKRNILIFAGGFFFHRLVMSNPYKFRYELVWEKTKCGSFFNYKFMPMKHHEFICVFGDSASLYNPQMEEGKPYARKKTLSKTNNLNYGIKYAETNNTGTRYPSTILAGNKFPQKWSRQQQGKTHPFLKPVSLLQWLIRSYSDEGDLVLDPFMGSGSTCLAAKVENRNYIGIELDKKYYDIAQNRIENNLIL